MIDTQVSLSSRRCGGALLAVLPLLALACTGAPAPVPVPTPVPAAATPALPPAPQWRMAQGRMMTRWAANVSPDNVLPDYPRPQMVRPRWHTLNGVWEFAVVTDSAAPLAFGQALAERILVPFAMESAISGIMRHAQRATYRRTFRRPATNAGERVLLHFDAVDWRTRVYLNGRQLGEHYGGYDAFSFDITDALLPGDVEQELIVSVFDPTDTFGQPRGKQVSDPEGDRARGVPGAGIWYTPVTGIWQTVWLEPVPATRVDRLHITPDVAGGAVRLRVETTGASAGAEISARVTANGATVNMGGGRAGEEIRIEVPNAHLWSPEDPFLYDLAVTVRDGGRTVDSVASYFGMRAVSVMSKPDGSRHIALNSRPVFQLGPLDQGWWPDGLYTAPTDEALRFDIEMTKRLGFNMTRKHIKVEPERWYYWADRLGLAVWQDMPSGWNDSPEARAHFESELREMLAERSNHPSIVVWVPFNEKWGQFDTKRIVGIIESTDSTRLVNDASGWQHEDAGDIIDVHRYQGPQAMRGANGRVAVVGEFGGLGYKEAGHAWAGETWGYGGLFPSREALAERYDLLVKRLYHDGQTHGMSAGVYTQLTDVEVELNGFMTYDRAVTKFDTARTASINRGEGAYITPELDEFTDAVRVTISSGRPVEIRYTTDGSEPTTSSTVYRTPFTVRQNTTVRARSFVNGAPTAASEARVDYRKVAGRAPATATNVVRGLRYEYAVDRSGEPAYRMDWRARFRVEHPEPRADDLPATKSGTANDLSLALRDTNEMFSLRWTGYIRVPRTGVYTFTALSDDGAAMWIGDRNIFWSVGQSPKTTESWGSIALQAGLHPVTFSYFQAYGPLAFDMYVEGPGLRRQRLPASMLFRDR